MRKIITVCLVVAGIVMSLAFAVFIPSPETDYLLRLYYGAQIVASLTVLIGGVIGVWQYYLASKDSIRNVAILRVQKAVDLSNYYKDNILVYTAPIDYVFENSGLKEIFDSSHSYNLVDFDTTELKKIYSDSQKDKLKKLQQSPKFVNAVLTANAIYNLGLNIPPQSIGKNKDNSMVLTYNSSIVAGAFMRKLIIGALNNMEYFAMNFNHNIADESVVYQSLHQSYIDMVNQLYYFIAALNTDPSDKYYTNVIQLYKTWIDEKEKQSDKRSTSNDSIQRNGTIIK